MYSSEEDGLPGNDDLGTRVLVCFCVCRTLSFDPGIGGFSINIPQFNSIDISLQMIKF